MQLSLNSRRTPVTFVNLGSGSRGNASAVWGGRHGVLVDCGLSCKQVRARLEAVGCSERPLDAILLTHEHTDHIAGLRVTARTLGLPVYMTEVVQAHLAGGRLELPADIEVRTFCPGDTFRVGDLEVRSFPVAHDSVDPVGFVVGREGDRVGIATDLGSRTPEVIEALKTCRLVLLEFNHDVGMLMAGNYPASLKQRIRGSRGHLSNAQAAQILESVLEGEVEEVVLGHLSMENNRKELVIAAARAAARRSPKPSISLRILEQGRPAGPLVLSPRLIP